MIVIATPLTQWDTGRSVEIKNIVATHVHFANKGDSQAVIMALENSQAKIPDYLLQTGKELCVYAVSKGVTIERKSFFVTKRERPENYVYKDDQRNYIYELITDAQEATEAANQATQNANEAADKANQAAKSWVIMGEAGGESITVDDAIDQTFAGFRIFGKTTQGGVPTPDAPVELVSVGDSGSITVNVTGENDSQSMTFATPNGLPGIPVSSGGNYTDGNGKQWILDEVDLDRGVRITRLARETITGTLRFDETADYPGRFAAGSAVSATYKLGHAKSLSNFAIWRDWGYGKAGEDSFAVSGRVLYYYPSTSMTVEEVNTLFAEMIKSETPPIILAQLATPIEIPLSEGELAAYATLHTSRYGTTVSNDAGAYMELEYVMDAKKYIDSLFTGGILPATVE